jgi:hypothetical protein
MKDYWEVIGIIGSLDNSLFLIYLIKLMHS